MPYSITTKDGITINNIPDDIDPNSDVLRQKVAEIRGGQDDVANTGGAASNGPDRVGGIEQFGRSVAENVAEPIASVALEAMAAINKGVATLADYPSEVANAVLQLSGSGSRLPKFSDIPGISQATSGGFMGEGLARDVIRAGGQMVAPGAAGQKVAQSLSKSVAPITATGLATQPSTVTGRVVKELGKETARKSGQVAGVAGAGAEIGRQSEVPGGEIVGALAGGLTAEGLRSAVRAFSRNPKIVESDELTSLLATQLQRSGMSAEEVAGQLDKLGPDAIPADAAVAFQRILRDAANQIPRVEGEAVRSLTARQKGQAKRLMASIDEATSTGSMTATDAIDSLAAQTKPDIDRLYSEARSGLLEFTPRLAGMMSGKGSVGRAAKKANSRLVDMAESGQEVTNLDVVDKTKQTLDDEIGALIRQGKMNLARDKIAAKNQFIKQIDEQVPAYKQARDMFAGKAQLEGATDLGRQFLKLKSRDVKSATDTMSESEKQFFRLGAKEAIIDRVEKISDTADIPSRLFGKSGDMKKLRSLFDDEAAFNKFSNDMEQEARYVMTRRAVMGNSTTAKQQVERASAREAFETFQATMMGDPLAAASSVGSIVARLKGRDNKEAYTRALEEAADLLMSSYSNQGKLMKILRKGEADMVERALISVMPKDVKRAYVGASVGALPQQDSQK